MKTLASQVDIIVDDKIARIAHREWLAANTLPNGKMRRRYVPYTLPAEVQVLVSMRSECADESTSDDRLEAIAAYATGGAIRELAFSR